MGTPVFGVVMVSASFYPHVGGAEKQALELSLALEERDMKVRVATRRVPGLPAREEVRGIRVDRLWCVGGGSLNALTFMLSLAGYLWSQAPFYEAIHVHLAGSPAVTAALMGRLLRKRVVVKLGGGKGIGELAVSSRSLLGRLKLFALAKLRPHFVGVARELQGEAARYLGPVPVHVVPNGVDVARYKPVSQARKGQLRAELGWPAEGLVFLYVGRFSPEKRLPWFSEIFCEAAKASKTPAYFAIVGEGVEGKLVEDAFERARMSARLFARRPMDDIEKAYAAADVFVLPSVSEGLSNALLEALSCGLAALASRVGGTPEAVEEATSGLLFKAEDAGDLRAQLDKLLARPDLVETLGRAAREAAVSKFSVKKAAERYETIYRWAP